MKKTYANCRWREVCIDPCDDCPNMADGKECQLEQGCKECYKIVCPNCNSWQQKLAASVDLAVIRIKEQWK